MQLIDLKVEDKLGSRFKVECGKKIHSATTVCRFQCGVPESALC